MKIINSPPVPSPIVFTKKKQNSGPANIAYSPEEEKTNPAVYVAGAGIGIILGYLYTRFRKVK